MSKLPRSCSCLCQSCSQSEAAAHLGHKWLGGLDLFPLQLSSWACILQFLAGLIKKDLGSLFWVLSRKLESLGAGFQEALDKLWRIPADPINVLIIEPLLDIFYDTCPARACRLHRCLAMLSVSALCQALIRLDNLLQGPTQQCVD